MDVKDFDYDLPEELIAQDPLEDRVHAQDSWCLTRRQEKSAIMCSRR
mgnify:CR=1 FL=1